MSKTTRIVFWILLVIFFLLGVLFIFATYAPSLLGMLPTTDPKGALQATLGFNFLWLFFAAALILDSRGKRKRAQKVASVKNP